MNKKKVLLRPLQAEDREQFILDNQEAFRYGALEEFGCRDTHFEEDGEIISRDTIGKSIDTGEAYRIICDGQIAGGAVVRIDGEKGDLELLFVSPSVHSKGIGYAAWQEIEAMYPQVKEWETITPYFEKRNIHFYVNRCGFQIVEFFNKHHYPQNAPETEMLICVVQKHQVVAMEKIIAAHPGAFAYSTVINETLGNYEKIRYNVFDHLKKK